MAVGRRGRKSEYDPELADEILTRVAMGENLHRISQESDMPTERTLYQWLKRHEDFEQNYARAKALRADKRSDRLDDLREKVISGEVDPQAARVAADIEKWQAGKEAPKKYGDKLDLNHGGQDGKNPIFAEIRRVIVDPKE